MPIPFLIPALIAGGATLLSGMIQGAAQTDAARVQADAMKESLDPYMQSGQEAINQMNILMGTRGADKQAAAISAIEQGPQMQAMVAQGENAMLQNAAATGGLRGGNLQGALAQFRPQVLNQLINQRMQAFGGIAGAGQQAAGMVGQSLGNAGAARIMGQGQMLNAIPNALMAGMGMYTGMGGQW